MRSVKKLFLTTLALTLTSFLMRTIGVWFNVYLAGTVGSVGIGIFQLILSVYAMSKTLSYGGMNLAATRLCIENQETIRHTMRRIWLCAVFLGLFFCALLSLSSTWIAEHWIMNESAAASLKILALSLPFVSASSALNGYMTAVRKMSRYSLIQLTEQLSRIGITVLFIRWFQNGETGKSLALVSLGITASEVISFSLTAGCYFYDTVRRRNGQRRGSNVFKRLLRIAVPDAIGAYIRSALNTIEHLLIPKGIKKSGHSTERALSDYGTVQGIALPIVLYPSSILGVVSSLLVPEIAECQKKKNQIQIDYIISRVLQYALLFSVSVMFIILIFAKELSLAVYKNESAEEFIRIIAPLIPIMYLDMTTDGMLKGLDQQLTIMKINVIDSVLCVILVWILVPIASVNGYVITIYVAEIINFLLSFFKLNSLSSIRFSLKRHVILPLVAGSTATYLARKVLLFTEKSNFDLASTIFLGMIFYFVLLRITGSITKEDQNWLKGLVWH